LRRCRAFAVGGAEPLCSAPICPVGCFSERGSLKTGPTGATLSGCPPFAFICSAASRSITNSTHSGHCASSASLPLAVPPPRHPLASLASGSSLALLAPIPPKITSLLRSLQSKAHSAFLNYALCIMHSALFCFFNQFTYLRKFPLKNNGKNTNMKVRTDK
jgi:hypothetical protein